MLILIPFFGGLLFLTGFALGLIYHNDITTFIDGKRDSTDKKSSDD